MKVIKPTKKEVLKSLRCGGCCWLGGRGCECYSMQLKTCYEEEKKRLTRTEYTEEEIKQMREHNCELWEEISKMLNELLN